MTSIDETLKAAIAGLMGVSGSPRLDAQLILGHVLNQPKEFLLAHGETPITEADAHTFQKLLRLRQKGMPIAYILGQRPFFDRTFKVTSNVLIPRPETEHVVEAALEWAADWTKTHPDRQLTVIDVGTGSGIIALSLAAHLPHAHVFATDVSSSALLVAHENGSDLANLRYVQSDLLAALSGPFDIICANLPYIATAEMNLLEVAKFEPHVALDGGTDGLVLIRKMLEQAPTRLARPGLLLLEMGADQGSAVAELTQKAFPEGQVNIIKDYSHLDRVVRMIW